MEKIVWSQYGTGPGSASCASVYGRLVPCWERAPHACVTTISHNGLHVEETRPTVGDRRTTELSHVGLIGVLVSMGG
jgi:hypothetical protein